MNENQKIAKIVADKSIFHEELRDLIVIMPHAEGGEHRYKGQHMAKINSNYDIFNKMQNVVDSRFENAFIEKFNEIFLVDILQRLKSGIRSNMELFETFAKLFSGKQYNECLLSEKINYLKKAIEDKFSFKICFFCLAINPISNTEIICYDIYLKRL